jgi:hypothetical protein
MHPGKVLSAIAGVVGVVALAGCPDPKGEFEAFQERFVPIQVGEVCLGATPPAGMRDGEYYFSLTPTDSPTKPAPFLATVTSDGATITVELLPLNADDRMSVAMVDPDGDGTFEPAPSQSFGPFPVAADGTFTLVLAAASVPGDTNPISANSLTVDADLEGAFCFDDDDLICGTFSAQVTAPFMLPLEGSWALERIEGGVYPAQPILGCDGTTAPPL